jgi:conjugal transfer mating pair stabilization protein TraG
MSNRFIRKRLAPVSILVSILAPAPAFALDADFYTWGGFDAVASGLQRLALIFSDGGYRGLFFSVIVMAIMFGGFAIVARAASGARANPVSWLVPILTGVVIYLGLVVPTGTIHLYDNQTNKYQAIGGIPDGIVAVAGILNLVERGMVEIVSTTGDPRSYTDQAGGSGFLGLFQAASKVLTTDDTLMDTSVNKYLQDCVTFELTRPGTTLTVDELRRTTGDFRTSLAKANSPAIYTVYYDLTAPQGQTMTCQQSWVNINTYLGSPAHLEENLKGICAQIGYDTSAAASYQKCKTSLQATFSDLGVSGVTTDDFVRQAYLSQRLHDVFRSGDTAAVANYKFLMNASGAMKAANEWLPIMKGVLTAVALGLVPFLALFIPTPLLGKAISVMLGFFIWLTAWGVTDALLHQFLMDYGTRAMEGVRLHSGGSGLGMDAFYFMPNETIKILGMFGTVRMAGLMLATVITGMLVRFGGHALATMGSSLMGQVQNAGQQAARMTEDPSGRAAALKSNAWSMPTETIANDHRYGYRGMMTEGLVNQSWGVEGAAARIQNMEALQRQGAVPQAPGRLGLGGFARQSQAMDKIATPNGVMGYGTTPGKIVNSDLRGEHTSATTDSMGWRLTSNTLKDEAGNNVAGTVTHSGAAGAVKTHLDDGREVVDQVELAGLSGKFGLGYREDAVRKGAHSLASENTWNHMWQKVDEDSVNSSEARSFKEAVNNNVSEETARRVENGSAFSQVRDETKRNAVEAGASIGLGPTAKGLLSALTMGVVSVDAKGGGIYQLVGSDGKKASFTASESEMNAMKNTASDIRESALARTLQTSEGRKYASSLSAQDIGKEGYSYIQEAAARDTTSTAQDMELMTAYAIDRSQREYGSTSIENIERTATDIAAQRTGSAEAQSALNKDIQGFIADRYRNLDNEQNGNWVLRDKAAIQNTVTGRVGNLREQAGSAANDAKAATADNRFDDPRPLDIAGPTNHAEKAADSRRGAINAAYNDNGAFDFGSNTFKQLGRDLARPMIPQPESPDARSLVGGPSATFKEPSPTPTALNTNPPGGISTLGNVGAKSDKNWDIDSASLKRLEELSQKLEGK